MNNEDWPKEEIPDRDALFMRVHRGYVDNGELQPGVFRDQGDGMSTNWQKYCPTPEEAWRQAKSPENNGVIKLVVGPIRSIPLLVEHTPDLVRRNRSHTDIKGKKTSEVRLKLLELFEWSLLVGGARL